MGSSDKVDVALISDEDVPTCFEVLSRSFSHGAPFVDMYFPHHDTPSGQAQGYKRVREWMQSPDDSTFLKAVARGNQGEQEHIIGFAIWTYMREAPPAKLEETEDVEEVWPDEDDREYMARLWRDYVIPRTQAVVDSDGKGVYVLELLAVHPNYQRLGAGTALVEWGTRAADERGMKAVVEGTPVARRLYERCGFQAEIEEMRFDVGEEFAERKKPTLIFMAREARS